MACLLTHYMHLPASCSLLAVPANQCRCCLSLAFMTSLADYLRSIASALAADSASDADCGRPRRRLPRLAFPSHPTACFVLFRCFQPSPLQQCVAFLFGTDVIDVGANKASLEGACCFALANATNYEDLKALSWRHASHLSSSVRCSFSRLSRSLLRKVTLVTSSEYCR